MRIYVGMQRSIYSIFTLELPTINRNLSEIKMNVFPKYSWVGTYLNLGDNNHFRNQCKKQLLFR